MTATQRSPWQDRDGFPTADYFSQVLTALAAADVEVLDSYREEYWEWDAQIGGTAWPELWISWRCDEHDAPDHESDFTGLGWYWVPYSNPQGPGDRAEKFTELRYLADPAAVASAVAELVATYRRPT